ncbi:hypothetical protein Kpho02_34570 [Kitasatospora phosalacinea]|uniref:Uncharacterized protein n=1 Tax=Kitasatospora phosalacinea TaxID=2065 RepID=A0A9W6Q9V9_9ACTN|nr:hypothetical protein [Kitasatospora phosalacinea]GLW71158.1 hypothetical protein Kpho02_34570 [Kitasatospora phosalacinea]
MEREPQQRDEERQDEERQDGGLRIDPASGAAACVELAADNHGLRLDGTVATLAELDALSAELTADGPLEGSGSTSGGTCSRRTPVSCWSTSTAAGGSRGRTRMVLRRSRCSA